ncbi:hypothetical protein ACSHWB_21120 [Lentzea sp. HUAS TT2]|uniref:hypothetical protein n=1 Tax=Lentzea sp. HUAS TT2 TaxID=3447454 RepID=UPI003F71D51E
MVGGVLARGGPGPASWWGGEQLGGWGSFWRVSSRGLRVGVAGELARPVWRAGR